MSEGWPTPPRSPLPPLRDGGSQRSRDGTVSTKQDIVDRRPWADTAPRVTYGPEALDDYLGSTLTYSQVPPRANAAVKVVTVLTNVNASEFRKELAFRFRKNAMRYFTKY